MTQHFISDETCDRISKFLQVKQVFTTPYQPRLNAATDRVHRWLISVIAIFCKKYLNHWEDYLQPLMI